jgi:hypothetical protein
MLLLLFGSRFRMEIAGWAQGLGDTGTVEGLPAADNNLTLTGRKLVGDADIGPLALMAVCSGGNERRFADYDTRLRRPAPTAALAGLTVWAERLSRGSKNGCGGGTGSRLTCNCCMQISGKST